MRRQSCRRWLSLFPLVAAALSIVPARAAELTLTVGAPRAAPLVPDPSAPVREPAPPAVLRPLETVALRVPELTPSGPQSILQQTPPRAAAGAQLVSFDSLVRLSGMLAAENLIGIGIWLLGVAGLTATLAQLAARQGRAVAAAPRSIADANKLAKGDVEPTAVQASNLLQPLIQAALPVVTEPFALPASLRVFGQAVPNRRYRVDAAHSAGLPHFKPEPLAPDTRGSWSRPAWTSPQSVASPHAPAKTAWEPGLPPHNGVRS